MEVSLVIDPKLYAHEHIKLFSSLRFLPESLMIDCECVCERERGTGREERV